jgi:glycine reductase
MKLELGIFYINNVLPGNRTFIKEGKLFVNMSELKDMLASDSRFSKLEIEIANPGESVRVINVLDVVDPRIKVSGGVVFPGWLGNMGVAGTGRTHVLKGVGVMETGLKENFYGSVLDMSGPGSELSMYSHLHHIVLVTEPAHDTSPAHYGNALKAAVLKTAIYLANASVSMTPDEMKTYEIPSLPELGEHYSGKRLPRVASIYITECHETIREPFIYGDNPRRYFPTVCHPNEFMDGAMVSGTYYYSPGLRNYTYNMLNNPVLEGLYERHGKELLLAGVVVSNAQLSAAEKKRSAVMAAKLVRFVLGADGVIITKEGGGHPDIDLMECCEQCELLGVKTALINSEMLSPDGTGAYSMVAFSDLADCVISVGNVEQMIKLPSVDRVIGGDKMTVGIPGPYNGPMTIPMRFITNAISQSGLTKITTEEY